MVGVTFQLGASALIDPLTIIIAWICLVLILRFRINSTWLIAGGAAVGMLHGLLLRADKRYPTLGRSAGPDSQRPCTCNKNRLSFALKYDQ